MRCILTVNFSPWSRYSGGGQRSTHNLARALSQRGHRVTVIFSKPPWERVQLPAELPYEVRRLLARDAGERALIHANGEEAALIPELRRRLGAQRFGFVVTPRYPALPAELARAQSSPVLRARLCLTHTKYMLLGHALRGADRVCPTSRFAAELVCQRYALEPARVRVIHNGVSDEFLEPALPPTAAGEPSPQRTAVAEPEPPFAAYFGRLAREKGVYDLLEALARAAPGPSSFVFAGRGPELPRLRARATQLGLERRVKFLTWLDATQLAALIRRAQYVVLPSHEESFGNTMAESLALGVPVISTRAGSIPELIEHERTGLLVAASDVPGLARAIERFARDELYRRRLGEAGRAHVSAHLTWARAAEQFEQVYAELTG